VVEASARAQAAQLLQTDQDLVLSTIDSYLSILRSDQLLQVADSNLAVSREALRIAEVRYNAGASPRLDVFRAQTNLADAQTRRISASNALAQSKAALNTLISRPPETPLRVEAITRLTPRVPLPASIETANAAASTQIGAAGISTTAPGATTASVVNTAAVGGDAVASSAELRAIAERTRPALQVGREQVNQAEANIDVQRAQRRPNLGLSIGGLLRNPVTFAGRFALSLGLGVAQTLFDSGRARSQITEARAAAEQARQGLQGQRLNVANQIEQSLLALDSAEERERSTDTAVLAAQETLRAAQIGYAAGVRTALEVSDAQNALLEAQTQAVNARFDVADSQAELSASVGVLTAEGQAAYQRALREDAAAAQRNNQKKK
jgi:outer membrane protein TolC